MIGYTDEDLAIMVSRNDGNLWKPTYILIDLVPEWSLNSDNICVYCENCEQFMRYDTENQTQLVGEWSCDSCGTRVSEKRVWKKVNDSDIYDSGDKDIITDLG